MLNVRAKKTETTQDSSAISTLFSATVFINFLSDFTNPAAFFPVYQRSIYVSTDWKEFGAASILDNYRYPGFLWQSGHPELLDRRNLH